jgi:serine/threonine-protein kinase
MQLKPGDKLGAYEIVLLLGKGGMGEVWKAHDSQIGRDVAIKVSDKQFSDRFEREVRAIGALNHNNICTLYHVGPNYLVMEYIEGPTLAERIEQGPIPVDEALGIARQIAAALEAAHEKPIVHRDLKPANVKIRPDGSVKVLDFGLATAAGEEVELSHDSPTMMPGTQMGMILGTAGYMSPEQARGQKADKRADIWAFGVVLCEMVTGKRLFDGPTVSDSLASILKEQPDLTVAPEKIRRLLASCLEKDPKNRLRDIGDWGRLLDVGQAVPPAQQANGLLHKTSWVVAVAAILIAVVAGVGWYRATRLPELKPLVRLDVDLGADVSLGSIAGTDTIISPDGTRLVYVSQGKLFTRKMDQPKAVELAGKEGALAPFFSPDGQWVAFFGNGELKKISVEGGAAVALCSAPNPRGGSWGEDGNIIAALTTFGGLSLIPAAGGTPTPVAELAPGEATHSWPQILPGGKAVVFTSSTSTNAFDGANIEVVSLADHRRKTLERGGTYGRYLPGSNGTGYLVYVNKGTLFAVPFDPGKLEVRGAPSPVLEEVAYSAQNGSAQFDFSRNGTLVYRGGGAAGASLVTAQWLDAAGKTQPLLAKPGVYLRPRLSPDGQRLALDDGSDIWVYEARRDTMTRLTFGGGANVVPVWSPDGRYIVFGGPGGIRWVRSDGAGKPQPLIQGNLMGPYSFAPDGKRLAYEEIPLRTSRDIWTVAIESDGAGLRAGKPEAFLQTTSDERQPAFSPDGRWLAYISSESGKFEVYVRAFPDKGGKWQISNAGGTFPIWSGNGHELFFRSEDNRIMVATYAAKADSFVPEKPRIWSDKRLADLGIIRNYDPAPDGKRIAALMPVETPEAPQTQNHVVFLENFADELQRKVPAGK